MRRESEKKKKKKKLKKSEQRDVTFATRHFIITVALSGPLLP